MDVENSNILVRTLRADDEGRLVDMDEIASGRRRDAWFATRLRRSLEDSDVRISLGAESDGTLVGAILGSVEYGEFGQAEPTAILDTVLVDAHHERQGVASALLGQLLQNLSGLRIKTLRTQVGWNEVDLISFFAKTGFEPAPRVVLELDVERGLAWSRRREESAAGA